jgi:hypothetical protein
MEKRPVIIPEEIQLFNIESALNKLDAAAFKKSDMHNLNVAHKIMHNLKDERVKMELVFSFKNEQENEIAVFQLAFHFHIKNMANFYELNQEGKPTFYAVLMATLLGISLSTARGVIFEKLTNNQISNIILPIFSPQKLLAQKK